MPFETVSELLHKSLSENTFAFSVDKDNLLADVSQIFFHHLCEAVDLEVEDVGVGEPGSGIEQIFGVEIHFDDCILWFGCF